MTSSVANRAERRVLNGFELFLVSFLALYFELLVIRWLSSEIRIFAYFKNIPLIACLFGLGLGMARSTDRKNLARWFPLGLMLIAAIVSFAEGLGLVHVTFLNPFENYLLGSFAASSDGAGGLVARLKLFLPGLAVLVAVFYLIVFTFSCLGQRLGQLLDCFDPLVAYSINVGASLAGILSFSAVSFMCWQPQYWLALGAGLGLWFFRRLDQALLLVGAVALAYVTSQPAVVWSPYYRIHLTECRLAGDGAAPPYRYGYDLRVNHDTIQGAYDNRPETLKKLSPKQLAQTLDYYDTPYLALGKPVDSVLILAAGTGNDVAAALRHGAKHIDAVEIDPEIVRLGKQFHPEQPYSRPSVNVVVDDARAFLRRSNKQYDLIVFSYLDSHAAFSAMSSIRLDNYVYTLESFRDAQRLLKPDGAMAVTFYYVTHWQLARLVKTLEQACGQEPVGVYSAHGNGPCFLQGPGAGANLAASGLKRFDKKELEKGLKSEETSLGKVVITTDDWPFLFLRDRGVSWMYAIGLIFTLCLGWHLVRTSFGKAGATATGRTMFCLGAAFMLIENKAITQMGLLLGTTWLVNSAVIGAVLLMILLATLLQIACKFQRLLPLYALLLASLLFCYALPLSLLNALPFAPRAMVGALILSLPVLFAAVVFAVTFSRVESTSQALAMNLLGTLFGGVLEYLSMVFGVNAMNLVAVALYVFAFVFWKHPSVRAAAPYPAPADLLEQGDTAG